jgi:hypothetical protein
MAERQFVSLDQASVRGAGRAERKAWDHPGGVRDFAGRPNTNAQGKAVSCHLCGILVGEGARGTHPLECSGREVCSAGSARQSRRDSHESRLATFLFEYWSRCLPCPAEPNSQAAALSELMSRGLPKLSVLLEVARTGTGYSLPPPFAEMVSRSVPNAGAGRAACAPGELLPYYEGTLSWLRSRVVESVRRGSLGRAEHIRRDAELAVLLQEAGHHRKPRNPEASELLRRYLFSGAREAVYRWLAHLSRGLRLGLKLTDGTDLSRPACLRDILAVEVWLCSGSGTSPETLSACTVADFRSRVCAGSDASFAWCAAGSPRGGCLRASSRLVGALECYASLVRPALLPGSGEPPRNGGPLFPTPEVSLGLGMNYALHALASGRRPILGGPS